MESFIKTSDCAENWSPVTARRAPLSANRLEYQAISIGKQWNTNVPKQIVRKKQAIPHEAGTCESCCSLARTKSSGIPSDSIQKQLRTARGIWAIVQRFSESQAIRDGGLPKSFSNGIPGCRAMGASNRSFFIDDCAMRIVRFLQTIAQLCAGNALDWLRIPQLPAHI